MLCPTCNRIDFDRLIPSQSDLEDGVTSGITHHASIDDLNVAAQSGCKLCMILANNAPPPLEGKIDAIQFKMRLKGRQFSGYRGCSVLWVHCRGKIIAKLEVYVPRDSVLTSPGLNLLSGRLVNANPASKESFELLNHWVQECFNSPDHVFCPKSDREIRHDLGTQRADLVLPTRLIDVGSADGSQEPKLILSSASHLPASTKFVALSHCWGQAQLLTISTRETKFDLSSLIEEQAKLAKIERRPLTTTLETVERRMQEIPMPTLPKTFQDAVTVTRGLGLRYIWIDSLCIIQDSEMDWQQEAARMGDVYGNSYVTVAAESSRDSHSGMLNDRIFDFDPIELPFRSKSRNISAVVYLRPALEDWETCVEGARSALRSRAWVLQESLLAPRTIRMSDQQIFWECRSRSLAEGNVTPIMPSKENERQWHWSHNKRFLAEHRGAIDYPIFPDLVQPDWQTVLYLQWYSIVRDYSHRKLSFPSDIFPALEALAKEFHYRLKDKYVAGLWKGDLIRGLLWRVDESKPGEIAREAIPYRAPSWSWASMSGAFIGDTGYCIYRVGDYHAEVIDAHISPLGMNISDKDHYTEISAGALTLRGRWCSCSRWQRFQENYDDPMWTLVRGVEEGIGTMFRYFDSPLEEVYNARHNNDRRLSLLEIASWSQSLTSYPVVHFLILESGDSGDETVFKRAGIAVLHKESLDLSDHEKWIRDWEVKTITII